VQAIAAINQAAEKDGRPKAQYTMGAQVWLKGKNLRLPYQSTNLAPKRYGPFTIIKEVSPMAYQLCLPITWGIHDMFHASLLSPYGETTQHRPNFSWPPPDLIEGEAEYKSKLSTIIGTSGTVMPCSIWSNGEDTPRVITHGSLQITFTPLIC
jgi:hypothetical protein